MILFLARIISFLSEPFFLVIPLPYLLVYRQTQNPYSAITWSLFSYLFIGAVGIFVMYCVRKGIFTDMDISKRSQRPLLFFFASVIAIVYLIGLLLLNAPSVLYIGIVGIFLSILVFSLINTKVKASIHVATISSLILILSLIYGGVYMMFIVLIPLIAWSRIKTKRHTLSEAMVGGMTGMTLTITMYLFIKTFIVQ